MITNPTPTRAEASDVANAVFEGADGVMLSAETAAGNYPLETVAFMDRILRQAEKHQYSSIHFAPQKQNLKNVDDATIQAATWMAEAIDSPVMITVTCSGSTALRAAQQRPKTAIFALTSQQKLARQLTLVWGVAATHTLDPDSFREVAEQACTHLLEKQWAKKGDPVVITAGAPFKTPGSTNMVRVAYAGHEESYASL